MNDEVYALVQADKRDRHAAPAHWHDKGWVRQLRLRDRARRRRLEELLTAGAVRTAADYYHAALLLQHGDSPDDLRRAHELATWAVELGAQPARWLAAATYDRWLMGQGHPQKFGTQIVPLYLPSGPRWEVWDVDPTTTDAERATWDVPPLHQIRHHAAAMTERAPPPPPQGAGPPWLQDWQTRKAVRGARGT